MRDAVRANPLGPRLHSQLGYVLTTYAGDHDAAIACLNEALRLDPRFESAHAGMGMALTAKRDLDGAIRS